MTEAQENAAYYAVITAPVRYDPELSSTAKLLYCEITSLCRQKGYCWATNSYFSELFALSPSTISRMISQLERRGHIKTETVAVANGSERRIYTDVFYVERVENTCPEGGTQKPQAPQGGCAKTARGGTQKDQGGVRKKRKQNDYQENDLTEYSPHSPPSGGRERKRFVPPSVDEVRAYCRERKNGIDPEAFVAFYASKGWTVGKSPMKDWRAAVHTWERKRAGGQKGQDDHDDWFR